MRAATELLVWKTTAVGSILLCGSLWWRDGAAARHAPPARGSDAAEVARDEEEIDRERRPSRTGQCPAHLSAAIEQASRPDTRCLAISRFARCRQIDEPGVRRIAHYTESTRSDEVRMCATSALGETQSETALPILNKLIGDAILGDTALRALAMFEHPEARQALIETARQGPDALRMTALTLLAERHDSEAVPLIAERLNENEPYVREQLIWLLGTTRDPRALSILSVELDRGSRSEQSAVINALGELGGEGAGRILLGVIETTPSLAPVALQALSRTGAEEGAETLLSAAEGEYGEQTSQYALQALVSLESPEATALMQRELTGDNPNRVSIAMDYLATHHVESAVPTILRIAREGGQSVIWGAVNALSRIGGHTALSALEQLSRTPGVAGQAALDTLAGMPEGRARASSIAAAMPAEPNPAQRIELLGKDRSPEARAALIEAARGADPNLSSQALSYLAQRRDPESVDAIADLAAHGKTPALRVSALAVLGQTGHPDLADRARNALRDPSAEVRTQAVSVLLETHSPEAQDAILSASRDTDPSVVSAATSALGQLGTPQAVSRLEELAAGASGQSKAQALQTLTSISPSRAARFAEQAAASGDRDSCLAAVQQVAMFPRAVGLRIVSATLRRNDYTISRETLPYLGQFGLSRRDLSAFLDPIMEDPQAPEDLRSSATQLLQSAKE